MTARTYRSRILQVVSIGVAIPIAAFIAATIVWWATTLVGEYTSIPYDDWSIFIFILPVAAITIALLFWCRRFLLRVKRSMQFSLKGMCLSVLVFATLFSTVGRKTYTMTNQQLAVLRIRNAGGDVLPYNGRSKAPLAIFDLFGHDPWSEFTSVDVRNDIAAVELSSEISKLQSVGYITFEHRVTDKGLIAATRAIERLPESSEICLLAPAITDKSLSELSKANVYSLFVNGCFNITDAGLEGFTELLFLQLLGDDDGPKQRLAITDAGLENIAKMTQLRELLICGAPITDAGVRHLGTMSSLERVRFRNTLITPEGVDWLRRALPNCEVEDLGSGDKAKSLH